MSVDFLVDKNILQYNLVNNVSQEPVASIFWKSNSIFIKKNLEQNIKYFANVNTSE